MRTSIKIGIASLAAVMTFSAGWLIISKGKAVPTVHRLSPDRTFVDAQKSPKTFIAKNEFSRDVKVQTAVTRARMTDAYDLAKSKKYEEARAEFMEASFKHKGTDAMDPAFGTLTDQAAYQAIVCLDAAGKKDEAEKEFRKFMTERKLSPLIHACFRRLERIHGKVLDEDQALLEAGIAEQEKQIRFETSVCGPKCLEKVLPMLGVSGKDYMELAKLCGTTDKGTTLDGLKDGCGKLGLKPIGLELNNRDFSLMKKPFLWLQADHYLAVLEIKNGKIHFYDPRFSFDDWKDLPKEDDPKFRAQVLAFEVPTNDLVLDTTKPSKKS